MIKLHQIHDVEAYCLDFEVVQKLYIQVAYFYI